MRVRDVVVTLLASSVLGYWAIPPVPSQPDPPPQLPAVSEVLDKSVGAVAEPIVYALPRVVSVDSVQHGVAMPYVTDLLTPPMPYQRKEIPGTSYLRFVQQ